MDNDQPKTETGWFTLREVCFVRYDGEHIHLRDGIGGSVIIERDAFLSIEEPAHSMVCRWYPLPGGGHLQHWGPAMEITDPEGQTVELDIETIEPLFDWAREQELIS
jgi:hypothetical protein